MSLRGKKTRFVHHKSLIQRGNSDLALVLASVQQALLFWLVLRDLFPPEYMRRQYVFVVLPVVVLLITLSKWIWGWFYEKSGLLSAEMQWLTRRNPIFQKMHEDIQDIKDAGENT
jgi:hypothetical protein